MNQNYTKFGGISVLLGAVFTLFFAGAVMGQGHQLTIYVDEGHGELNGHVFFGLSDGRTTQYAGWNSVNKILAPLALGGGDVIDESPLVAACKWDVRKTYDITPAGYQRARQVINKWDTDGRAWALNHHCGDFAEAVALAAGVPIRLPDRAGPNDRPGLFGEYLRGRNAESSWDRFYVNNYVDTGIPVRRGDKMSFRARGSVKFGDWVRYGGPDGIPGVSNYYSYFDNILHGTLIGRVKAPGLNNWYGWFYIGRGGETVSGDTGFLEFEVNDNEPENNTGKFEVEVRICRA